MRRLIFLTASATALAIAAPLSAQFSASYNFLEGVRSQDFAKVRPIVEQPGTTVINVRDRRTGEGALHIVTRRRDETWLLYLLRYRANPDIRDNEGNTPLHIAAQIGFEQGVHWLHVINADADPANDRGETPLILAVQQRNTAIVRRLIAQGADPDWADSVVGMSARDYAQRDPRGGTILAILESAENTQDEGPVMGPVID